MLPPQAMHVSRELGIQSSADAFEHPLSIQMHVPSGRQHHTASLDTLLNFTNRSGLMLASLGTVTKLTAPC
jgi:hypothetical protein